MKRTLAVLALALTLAGSAFAVETQHCYKTDDYTTVCKFSPSGRVNETSSYDDGTYFSTWYTAAEWKAKQAADAVRAAGQQTMQAASHEAWKKHTADGEAAAQTFKTQDGCEGNGNIWVANACHYSEAAKRVHAAKGGK